MAYHVTVVTGNDYRCSCCLQTWEDSWWVDTLEEALEAVPAELSKEELGKGPDGYTQLLRVEVVDGATREVVAHGRLHWPQVGKSAAYQVSSWSGVRNGERFDVTYDGKGDQTDEKYEDILARLTAAAQEQERARAQRELEAAQAKLDRLNRA